MWDTSSEEGGLFSSNLIETQMLWSKMRLPRTSHYNYCAIFSKESQLVSFYSSAFDVTSPHTSNEERLERLGYAEMRFRPETDTWHKMGVKMSTKTHTMRHSESSVSEAES